MTCDGEEVLRLSFAANPRKNGRLCFMLFFFFFGFVFCWVVLMLRDSQSIETNIGLACFSFAWLIPGLILLSLSQKFTIRKGEILREVCVCGFRFSKKFSGRVVFMKELCAYDKTPTAANPLYFYDFRVSENIDCKVLAEDDELFEDSQVFLSNAARIFLQVPKNTILKIAKAFEEPEIYALKKHFRTDNLEGIFNEQFLKEP